MICSSYSRNPKCQIYQSNLQLVIKYKTSQGQRVGCKIVVHIVVTHVIEPTPINYFKYIQPILNVSV